MEILVHWCPVEKAVMKFAGLCSRCRDEKSVVIIGQPEDIDAMRQYIVQLKLHWDECSLKAATGKANK